MNTVKLNLNINKLLLCLFTVILFNCNFFDTNKNKTNYYPEYEINNNFNSDFGEIKIGLNKTDEIFIISDENKLEDKSSSAWAKIDLCKLKVSEIDSDNPDNFSIDITGLNKNIDFEMTTSFKIIFHPVKTGESNTKITIKFLIIDSYDDSKIYEYYAFNIKGTGIN